jgi:hypothetical protein
MKCSFTAYPQAPSLEVVRTRFLTVGLLAAPQSDHIVSTPEPMPDTDCTLLGEAEKIDVAMKTKAAVFVVDEGPFLRNTRKKESATGSVHIPNVIATFILLSWISDCTLGPVPHH